MHIHAFSLSLSHTHTHTHTHTTYTNTCKCMHFPYKTDTIVYNSIIIAMLWGEAVGARNARYASDDHMRTIAVTDTVGVENYPLADRQYMRV